MAKKSGCKKVKVCRRITAKGKFTKRGGQSKCFMVCKKPKRSRRRR